MNGLLRRRLPAAIAALVLLGLVPPAFAQGGGFTHPAAWVSEIDFASGQFEIQIGPQDIEFRTLQVCMSTQTAVYCPSSSREWRANRRVSFTRQNIASASKGIFRISMNSAPYRTISYMQWGDRDGTASAAVREGLWANAGEFVAKPTTSGHSAQYYNPGNARPGLATWVSRTATIGGKNTPVELASFAAQGVAAGVRLRWRTESETANAGFRVLRSRSEDGPFQPVHGDLVPGQGSTPHATDYEHVDETAEPGTRYHYKLEDVAHDGTTKQSETITAQAGTPAP